MLSKAKLKYIRSLRSKKNRRQDNCFIAEGPRLIGEIIKSDLKIRTLYATNEALEESGWRENLPAEQVTITQNELKQLSNLKTPQGMLAQVDIPAQPSFSWDQTRGLVLALDGVQDPGNLGTIIRTAAWFGVSHLICSTDTVDCYNPKVVQATMGAIAHVRVTYGPLEEWCGEAPMPVYGADMDGRSIFTFNFPENAVIVLGREGQGLSGDLRNRVKDQLSIPRPGKGESLNVGMAAAIFCSEWSRQIN